MRLPVFGWAAVLPGIASLLLTAGGGPLPAQETREDELVYRVPDEGIPLEQVARDAEIQTGYTFLLSEKSPLKGKVLRFAGEARVPRSQALALFQALFVTQGYALKPLGDASRRILVVESIDTAVDLKQRATFVRPHEIDAYRNEVGLVVMTFFPLKHVKLQNVRAALAQILTSKSVEITLDVESANALIVIGFAPTVFAIKQVIAVMDVPQPETELRFDLLGLKHAVAEEIEPIVVDLISADRQTAGPQRGAAQDDRPSPKVIADPRLNALVVYAADSDMNEVRRLVAALDKEFGLPAHNLRIIRLRHVNADDIADVLAEAYGFTRSGGSGSPSPAGGPGRGEPGGERADRGGAAAPSLQGTGAHDGVLIVPEPHNNALLIRASRTKFEEVLSLVQTLDRIRPQVLVRGVIAELTDDQFKSIGAEIAAFEGGDQRYHVGAVTAFGLSTLHIANAPPITGTGPGSGTGTGGGMGGGAVSQPGDPSLIRLPVFPGEGGRPGGGIFGIFRDSLEVPLLISLLQDTSRGNLVSTPLLLANDNEQSSIEAARQIPTVVFQTTPTGDTSSFGGYQEAKISLTVSPHVSNDDYVRLEVELLVEAFVGTAISASVPPDKTSRRLIGSVTMRDGATAVIGGLILEDDRQDVRGVPPFLDAPIIGHLLSLRDRLCARTSLYFFLSPTIIRRFETLESVSYEKKLEVQKLCGPVRLIDPDFRPILLDHPCIGIDGIEASGYLDLPRYVAVVPLCDCPEGAPARDLPPGSGRVPASTYREMDQRLEGSPPRQAQ